MEKYLAQINLNVIGNRGQEKIFNSVVAIIGLGGLGSPIIQYLAASGVGRIIIIDDDVVELSNLSRQVIYSLDSVDKAKVDAAEIAAKTLNPEITVTKFFKRINAENIDLILKAAQIVVDASDNFQTRFLLNEYCHNNGKVLVSGAAIKMQGYLSVYKSGIDNSKPCFACFHQGDNFLHEKSCSRRGVLGAVVGSIGTMMAVEVIKEITMPEKSIAGTLLYYNALENRFKSIELVKQRDCICG